MRTNIDMWGHSNRLRISLSGPVINVRYTFSSFISSFMKALY